jgi:hypothetical protein
MADRKVKRGKKCHILVGAFQRRKPLLESRIDDTPFLFKIPSKVHGNPSLFCDSDAELQT